MQRQQAGVKLNKHRYPVRRGLFIGALLAWPLIQLAIFYFYVNFESFLLAFQSVDTELNTVWAGFSNFATVWKDIMKPGSVILLGLRNGIILWVAQFLIHTPSSLLFAFMIYKKYRGTNLFRVLVLLPSIISSMLVALMFKMFIINLPKLIHSMPDIYNDRPFFTCLFYSVWMGLAGNVIVYPNVMNSTDPSIRESARLEGASSLQEFWYIVLPLVMPTFTTYTVTSVATLFMGSGPQFLFWGYNAPDEVMNLNYWIFTKSTQENAALDYGYNSALSLLLTLITIPVTFGVKAIMEKADPMND